MAKYMVAASGKGELVIDGPQGFVPPGGAPGGKDFDDIMEYVKNPKGPPPFTYVEADGYGSLLKRATDALGELKETDRRDWKGGARTVLERA